ncbi:MAG: hypothetical protein CM15mP8_3730 [Methanobacteriota archaeon]|nr:MAG: hypothetical protein CM15mP8_3730 [Euryarchaeota archaeon]
MYFWYANGHRRAWFDGLEPALRAFMAIPAARGVAFGRGFSVVKMTGSQHNDPWTGTRDSPKLSGEKQMEHLLDYLLVQI